jgi:membrane fusion protein (multidrug efflux system)
MVVMLVLMALFIVAIGAWKVWQIKTGIAMAAKFAPPPVAVTTAVAKTERWQPVLSAVGSLKAVNGIIVSTDLAGIISQIAFQSGATVKKGDLLVKLDSSQEEPHCNPGAPPPLGKTDYRPPAQSPVQRGCLTIGLRFRR